VSSEKLQFLSGDVLAAPCILLLLLSLGK